MRLTKALLIIMLAIVLMGSSCGENRKDFTHNNPTQDIKHTNKEIDKTQTEMDDSAKKVESSANNIDNSTEKIESKVQEKTKPKIADDVNNIFNSTSIIRNESEKIRQLSTRLKNVQSKLNQAQSKFEKIEEDYEQMKKERDEAIEAKKKALENKKSFTKVMLRWIIVASVIGCGASIAVMVFLSPMTGGALLLGSGGTLGLSLVLEQYFQWIAFGGLVILAIVVGYVLFQLYEHRNALGEVINTTETVKGKLSPEDREEVFGHREKPGQAFMQQSKHTEKLVSQFREKLNKQWDHIVKDEKAEKMDEHSKTKIKKQKADSD